MNYKNTIKKEKDVFKHDLTNDENSYVYYLNKAIQSHELDTITNLNEMKSRVIEIITPAKDTPAKRNFIFRLNGQRDCFRALEFVYNATLNGQGLGVI